MKTGKPEGEEVKKLIKEFDEFMKLRCVVDEWEMMLYYFILWLYEERKCVIVPREKEI